jgi:hypothetical protein
VQHNKVGEPKLFKLFGRFSLVLLLGASYVGAESFEDFQRSQAESFKNYKDERDNAFNKYLKEQWKAYNAFKGTPLYEKPKPKVIAPAKPEPIKSVGPKVSIKVEPLKVVEPVVAQKVQDTPKVEQVQQTKTEPKVELKVTPKVAPKVEVAAKKSVADVVIAPKIVQKVVTKRCQFYVFWL